MRDYDSLFDALKEHENCCEDCDDTSDCDGIFELKYRIEKIQLHHKAHQCSAEHCEEHRTMDEGIMNHLKALQDCSWRQNATLSKF